MTASTAVQADFSVWEGRVEDDPLLRGAGRFGDDVKPEDALAAFFLRSPHAFANITRIDTAAARKAKGVVAVFTAADLEAAHYHSISHPHPIPGRGGQKPASPHRPPSRAGASCMSASRSPWYWPPRRRRRRTRPS
jgi:CO/xanthine dehydrogenase Mo-binding subunit